MSENCTGHCESCSHREEHQKEDCKIEQTLSQIKHKIVVMSGKGGVGKSTVSANLAWQLASAGKKVGLLDIDFHGPSIPKMLHLEGAQAYSDGENLIPVEIDGIKVMSIGFLLEHGDDPVVWRGPVKMGVIKQMFTEVAWGELDYLIIDCPPGTGDEPLTACQMLLNKGGEAALLVTTPQQVAATDVSKSISFCRQLGLKVVGIVENMSGFVCPCCGTMTPIFSSGAGEQLAAYYELPFLGKLPLDPSVCTGGDAGSPVTNAEFFKPIAKQVIESLG